MEKEIPIRTSDGYIIHGILNGAEDSDRLVIFIHGLTGEKENHLYYNGARFFPLHGIHSFRFDLFSNRAGGRCLSDCTISIFSADLDASIDYFSTSYSNIFLIGHSIGGCVVINSKQNKVKRVALWDTALATEGGGTVPFVYNAYLDKYIAHLKIEYLLSKQMIEERSRQDERILANIKCPIKLLFAGNTSVRHTWSNRMQYIPVSYEVSIIEGAGHGFDEFGVNDILFEKTLDWFTK